MVHLHPGKLKVKYGDGVDQEVLELPRRYTLTPSDLTCEPHLSIAPEYREEQVLGLYMRFMRDEVLAEWGADSEKLSPHVFCHVSGGLLLGRGRWGESIFRREMPLVLESLRHGDRELFESGADCDTGRVLAHLQSSGRDTMVEDWGKPNDFRYDWM